MKLAPSFWSELGSADYNDGPLMKSFSAMHCGTLAFPFLCYHIIIKFQPTQDSNLRIFENSVTVVSAGITTATQIVYNYEISSLFQIIRIVICYLQRYLTRLYTNFPRLVSSDGRAPELKSGVLGFEPPIG